MTEIEITENKNVHEENKMEMQVAEKDKANDLFISAVGGFGCWQKIVFAIFFCANIVGQWSNFAMTFLAPNTSYKCLQWSNNETASMHAIESNECYLKMAGDDIQKSTEIVKCIRWKYNETEAEASFISKFDLVCDREWLISFSKSVYMAGYMVSVFITGLLSDRLGRRVVILAGYILGCISLILSPLVNSMTVFLFLRFLYALGVTGSCAAGTVLVIELVGKEYRTIAGVLIQLGLPLGLLSLDLIAYFVKNWFWFQLAILFPTLALLLCYGMVPESPRYLIMHQKELELQKLIEIAAKKNDLKSPDKDISKRIIDAFFKNNPNEISGNLLDVFKNARMRRRILTLMYSWLVNYFIYYGIIYNTNSLAGNPYINFAIAGSMDVPSIFVAYYAEKKFGRKWSVSGLTLISCIPTGILILLKGPEAVNTGLSMSALFCISSSAALLYVYTGELFPTIVRNSAIGICDTTSRVGTILSPFVGDLGQTTSSSFPFMIYFLLALTSGVLIFWLPKTAGLNLPDTMKEGENLGTGNEEKTSKPQSESGIRRLLCCKY